MSNYKIGDEVEPVSAEIRDYVAREVAEHPENVWGAAVRTRDCLFINAARKAHSVKPPMTMPPAPASAYRDALSKYMTENRDRLKREFPPLPLTIQELQDQQRPWVLRNFGERPAHWPLLGIGEELGELSHAQLKMEQGIRGSLEEHHAAQKDAIADCIIFCSDYCSAMGWKLHVALGALEWSQVQVRARGGSGCDWTELALARAEAGKLDDCHINGGRVGPAVLGTIVMRLASYCTIRGWSLGEIVEETWAKVSKRDWKKNPNTAHLEAADTRCIPSAGSI